MKSFFVKHSQKIVYSILFLTLVFGAGRLYFELTDGFMVRNIQSNLRYSPKRELEVQDEVAKEILKQPFHYLAKGCQSYCFLSEDGNYVLKFFKYQRFSTSPVLEPLRFIPPINRFVLQRKAHKMERLDFFMQAWTIAYKYVPEESGLVYVHLNKTAHLNTPIVIYDKLGLKHELDSDSMEFLIQRRAEPLAKVLLNSSDEEGVRIIDELLATLLKEYSLGIGDHDPALLQNTGLYNGKPFHIDVGQFYLNPAFKDPKNTYQDLFNRTYEMRIWLKAKKPALEPVLTHKLRRIIGEDFDKMKPYFGRIRD